MSPVEVERFLSTQTRAMIVGSRGDEAPVGGVGRFHYQDGAAAFWLNEQDPVIDLIANEEMACCIVEQFPSYFEIKSVMLHGRSRRRPDPPAGEASFDFVVDKVVSFDFGKLAAAAEYIGGRSRSGSSEIVPEGPNENQT